MDGSHLFILLYNAVRQFAIMTGANGIPVPVLLQYLDSELNQGFTFVISGSFRKRVCHSY